MLSDILIALVPSPGWRSADAALFGAVGRGDREGLAQALALGADPDARDLLGRTACMWACLRGDAAALDALIAAGADPTALDVNGFSQRDYMRVFGAFSRERRILLLARVGRAGLGAALARRRARAVEVREQPSAEPAK